MKAIFAILFAWTLVWSEGAPPAPVANCGGEVTMACAGCCCCAREASSPTVPLAPVPARSAIQTQFTLHLPTVFGNLVLDRSENPFLLPQAEAVPSAGAIALFQRDCALLI